jgi:lysophospholipase L1-like esterase
MRLFHWTMLSTCLCLLATCLAGPVTAQELAKADLSGLTAPGTPFVDGDRLVFLGDSITQFGDNAGGYVQLFRDAFAKAAHPGVTVINAGISGNIVPDLQARLQHDVLAKRPTIVMIYIGINDVWHFNGDLGAPKDHYVAGLHDIIGQLHKMGAIVILTTPSVIGEKNDGSNPLDASLDNFADTARALAKEMQVGFCDLRSAFKAYLKTHNPQNVDKGILTIDGVHLSTQGNILVAQEMTASLLATLKNAALMPVMSGGDFTESTYVAIGIRPGQQTKGMTIHYTVDGSVPTAKSPIYRHPFALTATTTVKASFFGKNNAASTVVSAQYTKLVPLVAENPAGLTNGLDYQYFEGYFPQLPDFTTLTPLASGTVNTVDLSARKVDTNFALKFTGYVEVATTGVYTFATASDDGSALYIGNVKVVDNDGMHGVQTAEGNIALQAGKHPITITYMQGGGGFALEVDFALQGSPLHPIPAGAFFHVAHL